MEINSYDSEAYTRRLQSVVYGTPLGGADLEVETEESAEQQPIQDTSPEELLPEDILPEEEEIMNN